MSAMFDFESQVFPDAQSAFESNVVQGEFPVVNWERVMRDNEQRLYNFIRKRVANFADIEDLVQNTWYEVIRNKHKFCGTSRPETWMFGIAVNLVKNHYKSVKVSYLHDELNDDVLGTLLHSEQPEGVTEGKDILSKVLQRIAQLPEDYQQLLQLIVDHDISYQEAADRMTIPIGTVRSRLSRLRQSLKQELGWDSLN
ncbi:RNA polymerase sigma factor [Cedecea neteri]|uniref:RNA polymerase sigma factor n=1 Tax=Cedecea neteri TaxID=158822 RepID=UPI0028935778|nr:RNA polymerase sigma factor [Cedecea neteri]WNJ78217.1 RNA polymerase sigma factor [Cedecea neteri]